MCRSLGPVVIERCCVAPSEVVSPVCALVERRAEVGQFCQVCRGKRLWLSARVQDEQAEPRESVDADRLQHRLLHGASDAGEAVTSAARSRIRSHSLVLNPDLCEESVQISEALREHPHRSGCPMHPPGRSGIM